MARKTIQERSLNYVNDLSEWKSKFLTQNSLIKIPSFGWINWMIEFLSVLLRSTSNSLLFDILTMEFKSPGRSTWGKKEKKHNCFPSCSFSFEPTKCRTWNSVSDKCHAHIYALVGHTTMNTISPTCVVFPSSRRMHEGNTMADAMSFRQRVPYLT